MPVSFSVVVLFVAVFLILMQVNGNKTNSPAFMTIQCIGGGYTNQVLRILLQSELAEYCGSSLYLGTMMERLDYNDTYHKSRFIKINISSVLDVSNIPQLRAKKVIEKSWEAPIYGDNNHLLPMSAVNCSNLKEGGVFQSHFDPFEISFKKIVLFLKRLKIKNKHLLTHCKNTAKELKPYTCWHPRNEPDWDQGYNWSKVTGGFRKKTLYVMTGVPLNSTAKRTVYKDDFKIDHYTSTEKLQFDFCVCHHADDFVGVYLSSLSYYIWIVRLGNNNFNNKLVTHQERYWSDTMHALYVESLPSYFNIKLASQLVIAPN